ncbi:MAG: UxaA family hydrolase [Phycisphaerae bacterium]
MQQSNQLETRALRLSGEDNVATALREISPGTWTLGDGTSLRIDEAIPVGFKVALVGIAAGEPVVKYGHVIGRASEDIAAGSVVHVHNMSSTVGAADGEDA